MHKFESLLYISLCVSGLRGVLISVEFFRAHALDHNGHESSITTEKDEEIL